MARKKQTPERTRRRKANTKASTRKKRLTRPGDSARTAPAETGLAFVGIGASAGGLNAFKQLFTAMPDNAGMAFVLIQHLDPTHKSLTAELLGKYTRMSVVQVEDEMRARPNCVYVIPPKTYLTVSGETLHLTEPVKRRGLRVPIDFFFRSLADDQQERAIGIILSGTGSDGTLGVREIKAGGGMVMVQSPGSAQYDGMPRSAIGTGVVDYVLPVEQMPDALIHYVRRRYVNDAPLLAPVAEQMPDHLTTIIELLRARVKYDFSCYKKGTLTRRVQRRMGLKHVEDMGQYVDILRQDKGEVASLYKDLLISVTSFFREEEAWKALEKRAIEPLVCAHEIDSPIRVWVPGCATGEEPYSLAMLLTEQLQEADKGCGINIFASDIDQDALAFARAGLYPETIAADTSPKRLRRFFVKGEHTYHINKDIREAIVFAEQNVISDPPFSRLDLISCRNLLIYLEPEIQKKIMALFHFALRDGGYLFLGNAETITQRQDLFESVSRKWRIYRRVAGLRRELAIPAKSSQARTMRELPSPILKRGKHRLPAAAQQAVLQRFAPACALVNHKLEVLYLQGPVDDYLQLPSGEQTHDLIGMARHGLRSILRAGVQQAIREDKPVTLEEVRVRRGQQYFPVRVSIEPLRQPDELACLVLLAFDESGAEQRVRVIYVEPPESVLPDKPKSSSEYQAVVRQLERQLTETREDLQALTEKFETSNEGFKAANEEVTSINEELQSTNEELETSQEELQSLNEELQTVNSQLETKIDELGSTNNDLINLLASIDHATLFLDSDFRIRRFTPLTTDLLRVVERDIGRPCSDFAKNIADEDLLPDAEKVLKQLSPVDKEVQDSEGRWYVRRIVPYRTEDDRVDGVVITFVDVTTRKLQEEALKKLTSELEQMVVERTDLLQLVHDITASANQARTVDEAMRYAIERICQYNGWRAGHVYAVADDDELVPTGIWHTAEGSDFSRLVQVTGETRYRKSSKGMVPAVARSGEPQWIEDLAATRRDLRDRAGDLGPRAGIAFPVFGEHEVQAILEFYAEETIARDERCLEAMQNVGTQLGRVIERKRLEKQIAVLGLVERQGLGRELHDSLGQQMTACGMLAAALRDELGDSRSPASEELVDKLESNVEKSKRQVQSLIAGLFPVDVDGGGLPAALERLAAETTATSRVACRFECERDLPLTDNFTATQLFLIAGEAIHNAVKHARAAEVVIRLSDQDGVRVTITDNGIGLPPDAEQSSGMGLRIMRHRASLITAELNLESPPEGGTMVSCFLDGRVRGIDHEILMAERNPNLETGLESPRNNDQESR